ncbi:hypothetical protein [Bernardetia sp.]|uniref:hypothetical protein n=1 Tax=Bernardetia sp. TaxID=1937974 RepID=UPI0025C2C32D|nr:hypothetical protein [Bernardetia sp.]
MQRLIDYLVVFAMSMFKFIFGCVGGAVRGFSYFETVLITVLGMMTSVIIFTFFGISIRNWYFRNFRKKRKIFSKRSRNIVKIWRKYGIVGVAFLTPVIFSPIVGTIIAVSFGEDKKRIFFHMLWSATIWAMILSYITTQFDVNSVNELKNYFFN